MAILGWLGFFRKSNSWVNTGGKNELIDFGQGIQA